MQGHTDEAPKKIENLLQLPGSGSSFHRCMDINGEHRAEPVPPKPHRLVANINAAFVQKILHVPKRKRKPDVHHYREADHLRAGLK
jgi:hypothetical protein